VDSILIDEARTPLIISGQAEKPTERYYQMAKIAARMRREQDFTIEARAAQLPSAVAAGESAARSLSDSLSC
jgi:preprotein translocase subunit SecA